MLKAEMEKRLQKALDSLASEMEIDDWEELKVEPTIEVPDNEEFGDLATSVALELGSKTELNPREIAQRIVQEMDTRFLREVTVDGPGFINFSLDKALFLEALGEILSGENLEALAQEGEKERVQVEFVSSNPTGPLTVGHGRQAVLGDVLAALYDRLGYRVGTEYYFNDEGRQIYLLARTLWGRYRQALGDQESIPEDGYQGDYLIELGEEIAKGEGNRFPQWDEETEDFFKEKSLQEMIARIKNDLASLGVEFDNWFRESSLHEEGAVEETLKLLEERDGVYREDGALWLKAEEEGAPQDVVLIKSDGDPTYLLPDIAYHLNKRERGFHKALVLLGADHQRHVQNMEAALKKLGFPPDFYEVHISQFVSLYRDGEVRRMSTRKGEFVTLGELVEDLGSDVVRYFMADRKPESHLEFDYDLAKEESMDNPVYYLQYAHTRIASIFRKAGMEEEIYDWEGVPLESLDKEEELELIKKMDRLPGIISSAAYDFAPHYLTNYAEDLAAQFHRYYNKYRVLAEDDSLRRGRLALCRAVQLSLKEILNLLGVAAPEEM